jgi:RimJ/RimL family protein N-acetyltransferase
MSDEEAAAFLEEMSTSRLFQRGSWAQIGICGIGNDYLVGDLGLLLAGDGKHAEIGVTLRRESHGTGVATRAVRLAIRLIFEFTDVEEVRGVTDDRNVSSKRLLARVGMHRVDSTRRTFRGEHCVEHTYAIRRGGDAG